MNFFERLLGIGTEEIALAPEVAARFPYELIAVPGSKAMVTVEALQREGRESGFTAVLLGDAEDVAFLVENLGYHEDTPAQILQKAQVIDHAAWFVEREAEEPDYFDVPMGFWPEEAEPNNALMAHLDILTLRPRKQVYIGKIPTSHSWEVPAYLKLGGWNECPFPEHQVAISKYWHERYGAELVVATRDTVEYQVARPAQNRGEAERLAREQFLYCADIVHQGSQTLNNLTASLLNGTVWYFWWD